MLDGIAKEDIKKGQWCVYDPRNGSIFLASMPWEDADPPQAPKPTAPLMEKERWINSQHWQWEHCPNSMRQKLMDSVIVFVVNKAGALVEMASGEGFKNGRIYTAQEHNNSEQAHHPKAATAPPEPTSSHVNHPPHYGGSDNPYEAIKVIEAWDLDFCLGNTVKYIARAGKKDSIEQELRKALWYLERKIANLEKE